MTEAQQQLRHSSEGRCSNSSNSSGSSSRSSSSTFTLLTHKHDKLEVVIRPVSTCLVQVPHLDARAATLMSIKKRGIPKSLACLGLGLLDRCVR